MFNRWKLLKLSSGRNTFLQYRLNIMSMMMVIMMVILTMPMVVMAMMVAVCWQEVWRNRGMREWSCEVTPPDQNTKTNTLSNTKKRPSSKRKYRHTMSNESQMYLQCEKETIKILTKSPFHPFSVNGVCCVKCEMMHPLGITCLSH